MILEWKWNGVFQDLHYFLKILIEDNNIPTNVIITENRLLERFITSTSK